MTAVNSPPTLPVHVLSPSHLHVASLASLPLLPTLSLIYHLRLHAFMGLPCSSPIINNVLSEIFTSNPPNASVFLLIPDFRFGNYSSSPPARTLNVCRSCCNPTADIQQTVLALTALTAISQRAHLTRSTLKMIPWDLMVRRSIGSTTYDGLLSSYSFSDRIVDVSSEMSKRRINLDEAILDRGGHPSLTGLTFLVNTIIFDDAPPPQPTLLLLLTTPRTLAIAALIVRHRIACALIIPLQRKLAIIRPRRAKRGVSFQLFLAYALICLYQMHLFVSTVLMQLCEAGFKGAWASGYRPSVEMIFGWKEFRDASPPLLTV